MDLDRKSLQERAGVVYSPKSLAALKASGRLDHFIEEDGQVFAGRHLILDVWGSKLLSSIPLMRQVFEEAVVEAKATLLHLHLHHFSPNGGISAVAVLAESHISVHTWPECDFAAFDVFMCGESNPQALISVIERHLKPSNIEINQLKRGTL